MTTRKLTSTDAFVVVDLPDAPAAGVARSAPKLLVDGATWLARSQTYQFAAFERKVSGASAGVNSPPDAKAEAIAAFVGELEPEVASGTLLFEPGRGVGADDLAGLRAVDARPAAWWENRDELRAVGVAAAAATVSGGTLEGRTVAVEGFDAGGAALVKALADRGATVVAVGTASGSVVEAGGLDPAALADGWSAHGAAMVGELGGESGPAAAVLQAPADVLVLGSKAGVLDHEGAVGVRAGVIVPSGPLPVTAKALAALGRSGVVVLPDFVTTAGHLAAWPVDGLEVAGDLPSAAAGLVEGALVGLLDHPAGPVLGACERAEAFLTTWTEIPFGRPIG